MQVKTKFKQTEVGLIPDDWQPKRLGDVTTFVGGSQPPRSTFVFRPKNGYVRLVQIRDYKSDDFKTFVPAHLVTRSCTREDVMIGRYGPPIFQILRGIEGAYNVALIKAIPSSAIERDYLYHFLKNDRLFTFVELLSRRSSGQTGIQLPDLREFPLPLPPLSEQRAIAEALSDVDSLISSLDKLIVKKRDIKQATMQQLLSGKKRLPGYASDWRSATINDIVDVDPESLSASTPPNYRFKYISLEDVNHGFLESFTYQDFEKAPSRARRKLRPSDILLSTVRPNLKSHLLFNRKESNWVCSTGFSVLRCKPTVAVPEFLFYCLFSDQIGQQIDSLLVGSNYPAINTRDVRSLKVSIPSYDEQLAISRVLSDMTKEIEKLSRRRDKTNLVKQGMMQELLTGRTRLV